MIEPKGAKFSLPLPLLWQHDKATPIGQVLSAKVTSEGIAIRAQIAKGVLPKIEEAWALIKSGLVRGLSIGFRPLATPTRIGQTSGVRIASWEWLELSAVTVPANAATTITAIKSYDTGHVAPAGHPPHAAGSTQSARMKPIADRVKANAATLKTKTARLEELDALETIDDAQREERDTLVEEVKDLTAEAERLEVMEKAQMRQARPALAPMRSAGSTMTAETIEVVPAKLPPGIGFARMAMVKMAAYKTGESPLAIAKARYPDFTPLHLFFKGAVDPGQAGGATSPSWGGELSNPETLVSEFIEYLRPQTIIGRIPNLRRIPFNVRITGQSGGGTGYWVGEAKAKPVTSFGFLETFHYWHKAAAIAVLTEELARFSSPSAEALVRDALAGAVIERLDTDFIDPDKASATGNAASPASVLNGTTPLTTAGTDADSVSTDVAALAQTFIDVNIDLSSAVLIMPPGVALKLALMRNANGVRVFPDITRNGGTLEGFPVVTSQYAAQIGSPNSNILAMISAQDIYLSDDGQVTVDVSREASIEMSNTPEDESGTVVSMFQTNQIALRAERFITWSKRRTNAARYVAGVNYTTLIV